VCLSGHEREFHTLRYVTLPGKSHDSYPPLELFLVATFNTEGEGESKPGHDESLFFYFYRLLMEIGIALFNSLLPLIVIVLLFKRSDVQEK